MMAIILEKLYDEAVDERKRSIGFVILPKRSKPSV